MDGFYSKWEKSKVCSDYKGVHNIIIYNMYGVDLKR